MKVSYLESFPPNSNPFHHDFYNMGTNIGTNVTVMMGNHDNEECRYLIIVDRKTGKRLRITFEETSPEESPTLIRCDNDT